MPKSSLNNQWENITHDVDNCIPNWNTFRLKISNGYLYKTVDKFEVTDREGKVAMTDWKVTVTFVPELTC